MNELEKIGFATYVNNGDGWERVPNAKFMMKDEDGTEIKMTPNEVIKQLMQDNKSLEYCINNLQSKIDKVNKIIDKIKDLGDWLHIPAWELEDILKEDKIEEIPQFKGTTEQLNRLSILKEDK